MKDSRTFTNVDDAVLVSHLCTAQTRVTFVAPGITEPVAKELLVCLSRLGPQKVNVILDVDPEICRLGYGDIIGLELIKTEGEKSGLMVCHQPGIRLGLLITDAETLIYAPTPQLIEAGAKVPDKPNGICISDQNVGKLWEASGADGSFENREVGMDPAKTPDIELVKQDLERNPPKRFDVARAERVFNSKLQYVEFSFEDYKLSKKTVSIPAELTGITQDKDLLQRWRNSFRLFSGTAPLEVVINADDETKKETLTEKSLENEKKAIIKEFLMVVPNFGTVILRSNLKVFNERINTFKERVEALKEGVIIKIEEHLAKTKGNLITDLVPHVTENPPEKWKKTMTGSKLSEPEARERLEEEVAGLFGSVDRVFDPKVRLVFKEVTYDTIQDRDFQNGLGRYFPPSKRKELFNEYDAAPEMLQKKLVR